MLVQVIVYSSVVIGVDRTLLSQKGVTIEDKPIDDATPRKSSPRGEELFIYQY